MLISSWDNLNSVAQVFLFEEFHSSFDIKECWNWWNILMRYAKIVHFPCFVWRKKWEICAPVPVRDLQVDSVERIPLWFSTSGDAVFIVSGWFFNSLFFSRLRVFCDSLDALFWLGNGSRLASWSMARTECLNIYQLGRMFAWWCVYLLCYLLLLSLNGVLWLPSQTNPTVWISIAFRRFAAGIFRRMVLNESGPIFPVGNICQVWRIRVRMHPANMRITSHEIISLRSMAFPTNFHFINSSIFWWLGGASEKWMRSFSAPISFSLRNERICIFAPPEMRVYGLRSTDRRVTCPSAFRNFQMEI